MNQTAILWPMVAHALLIFIVYTVLAVRRRGAIRTGEAKIQQFKGRMQEPESSFTAANNLMNQFELPVLFHVVCLALFVTAGSSDVTVAHASLLIVRRYAHAYVHLTTNKLKHRNQLFRSGVLILFVLWVCFALHLAGAI